MLEMQEEAVVETRAVLQAIRDSKECPACGARIDNDSTGDDCRECGMSLAEMIGEMTFMSSAEVGGGASFDEEYTKEVDELIVKLEQTMGLYDPVAAMATRAVH